MRALCINDRVGDITGERPNFKFGDLVEVSQRTVYENCFDVTQHLYNFKTGERKSWFKSRFIPLSDIDETELIKEREQLITI